MMFLKLVAAAVFSLVFSAPAVLADDVFRTADGFFEQREGNRQAIANARREYLKLADQLTGEQLVRAIAQLGRLAIYEGEMVLPKNARAERRTIFQQCWCAEPGVTILGAGVCRKPGFVEKIKSVNGKEHPAYYYFKGVCLAYWGEQGSAIEKLAFVGQLESLIQKGPTVDFGLIKGAHYEGGGVYRLAGGFYSNEAADVLGYYNPRQAYTAIEKALAAPASAGDPSNGAQYFDNHQGKVSVMIQLHKKYPEEGWNTKGVTYATQTLQKMEEMIDFDSYPAGRKAEFMYNYNETLKHYKTLTGRDWAAQ